MLSASASKAIGLQIGKVELAEVQRTIRAVGSVELPWSQQAYASTLIPGRIEQVSVKPGESVQAGQELARVAGAELENLQLELLQASTEKSLALLLLKGHEAAGEGTAGKALLQARTDAQRQAARFNAAWQKLKALGLSNETLHRVCETRNTVPAIPIVSPIAGVVSMADVRVGQIVQPTEHLYHVVDPASVWIVAKVLEADAGQVKAGLPVNVTFAMLPNRVFHSAVDHIDLRLNADRTLSVKALLPNARGAFKPGMFGRIEIQLAASKEVVCPTEALIRDGLATDALVEQSVGNYVRKPVVVAAVRGQKAEIADGLFPGDKVVTVGSHELAALFAKRFAPPAPPGAGHPAGTTVQGQVELPTDQKTFASAPIEGRIRRILVEHGQRVGKGDVLAELESLQFTTMQIDFLQARTSLAQAALDLKRAQALSHSLARKDVWQLQNQHDTCQQQLASLRRQLTLVGLSASEIARLEETDFVTSPRDVAAVLPIRAAADGLICEFDMIPGQFVKQQGQLFELHNPTKVWIRAFLFEQDARHIRAGQTAGVGLVSDPTFRATGKVDRLDPLLSSGNRVLSIWTELDNPALKLKEGMAAMVTVETPKSDSAARN
jgi:RND family efflux transporter MFP subunit